MKKKLASLFIALFSLVCLTGAGWLPLAQSSGAYVAQGVNFSATTAMHRAAALTGITDSKTIMISFWFRAAAGTDANTIRIFDAINTTGQAIILDRLATSGVMRVICQNSAGTDIIRIATTGTFLVGQGWKHILISVNLATATLQMYVEDVSDINITTNTNDTIEWATGASDYDMPNGGLPGPFD